jgi:hypothetical protein
MMTEYTESSMCKTLGNMHKVHDAMAREVGILTVISMAQAKKGRQ